ncbi:MAG: penicillin-binding protein 1C, partial [Rhodobacteraceae bacterium]|nr:penicillin-binding protein 1C [Paracoccaceae bacterium]
MRKLFALVVVLWAAALGRDAADDWIDRTELPVLVRAASTEIRDRDGQLLRAYTVSDGRWRMALSLDQVDPLFFDMLIAYEDRRFPDHP